MRGWWLGLTLTGAFVFATPLAMRAQVPVSDPTPRRSYVLPAIGIVSFDFLLNRYGKHSVDPSDYAVSLSSVRRNATGPWVVDNDPFSINQFLHPYQGSMYHGFARSAGLNYWQSLGYALGGSTMWELAGETT